MAIWKMGCNWARNPNSFYPFIHDESIVLGYTPIAPIKLDDLVLITSGYLVRAIVQVDQKPRSITASDYRFVTNQYGIEWAPTTIYSKAEWFELPANMQFIYQCQRGAAQVSKQEILDITNEIWNNRN